jgi:hypothetical protein
MSGETGSSFYQEVRQDPCGYCLAPAGDRCRTRRGRVLGDGYEHLVRVQSWRRRWLAAQPQPPREVREAVREVTLADVTAGMRERPGFAQEAH